jgi:hypothetical protein
VLAVAANPSNYAALTGAIAVMSPTGSWRLVSESLLGSTSYDLQFFLTPDGSRLLVDGHTHILVVSLSQGKVTRWRKPRRGVAMTAWTNNDVLLSRNGSRYPGYSMSLTNGEVVTSDFPVWGSSLGPEGEVILMSSTGQPSHLTTHEWTRLRDGETRPLNLSPPLRGHVRQAPSWRTEFAVSNFRREAAGFSWLPTRAVWAYDPVTGLAKGALKLPLSIPHWSAVPIGESHSGWQMLHVIVDERTNLVAWHPESGKLRPVIMDQPQAQWFSVALDLIQ